MKCKNCGAEIPNNATECTFCDTPVSTTAQTSKNTDMQPQKQTIVEASKPINPLIGKEYTFSSSRGANPWGFIHGKIFSEVKVGDDRLFINITPKRFNVAPAVLFEDITGINISAKIPLYYWIYIILSVIGGFIGQFYLFIFTVLFIFMGLNQKITISQRSGVNVVMYARSKAVAEEFKADMKKLTKIQ